jgi:glyoxylase-like metal-dependent hydrolase (beta-lactamase superfamily II)
MPHRIHSLPLGPIQTNCYLVADVPARAAVVIDPGAEAGRVLDVLKKNDWDLQYVLLTHAHFDHIGAVAEIAAATRAPLAIHPKEVPLLRAKGGALLFGLDIPAAPEPDILLAPGQVLACGALTFEVLLVPGHTPGHVAFYCRQAGAVFSGDVLFQDGIGRTDLPGGDYATLMRSIRDVLFHLPPETVVYSGHGPATTLAAERQGNPFLAD